MIPHIAMVCCNQRDQDMLPIFIEQWQKVYPSVPLFLANCSKAPVENDCGLQEVSVCWDEFAGRSIMRAMLTLALEHDADCVWKCDVDAWHRADFLSPIMKDQRILAAGIQWKSKPANFLGIAYAVRRSALVALECKAACSAWRNGEDAAMSHMIRAMAPNQIHLLPNSLATSAQVDRPEAMIVHCGSYQQGDGRILAYEKMRSYLAATNASILSNVSR
jgi:hypothetical protein